MATERERLEEELALLQELQSLRPQQTEGNAVTDLAQSFNTGLVNLVNLPSEIINLPLGWAGLPQIPTEDFRQKMADLPVEELVNAPLRGAASLFGDKESAPQLPPTRLTAQPGEEAEGFLPRSLEILGGSAIPHAAVQRAGAQVLRQAIPAAQRTVMQHLTATTAKMPLKSATLDIGSSFGAGFGGEVTSEFTDDPTLIVLGELAGGFTLPTVTAASRIAGGYATDKFRQTILPFTKAGATPRAANRMQKLSADAADDAMLIDKDSLFSPARQTGNPRLIALENKVLNQAPEMEARFTEELQAALAAARSEATNFGGTNRVRDVLSGGQEHLVNLVNLRAAQAAQTAQARIAKLGGNATQRDISRIARSELDKALKDAKAVETRLYNAINKDSPLDFDNAKQVLKEIDAETGVIVPSLVPKWVRTVINTKKPIQYRDAHRLNSRLRSMARQARKTDNFELERLYNRIAGVPGSEGQGATGVVADIATIRNPNVDIAIAYSRQLHQKFSQGEVSAILSRGANRGAGVASADTLNRLFAGSSPATDVKAFIKASPKSAPQVQQYIRARFVNSTTKGDKFNQVKAATEIDKLEAEGMFELFPNLRGELNSTRIAFQRANDLAERAATVSERGGSRLNQYNSDKSIAGIILGAEPGQEMSLLLRQDNPEVLAAALVRRMGSNTSATQGLKTIFMETLWREASVVGADGVDQISGVKLLRSFNENLGVAKRLGMKGPEITRTRKVINQLVRVQTKPATDVGDIIEDTPASIMRFFVTLVGAKGGQRVAGAGMGSSMKMAAEGSAQANKFLQEITIKEAQSVVIAAQSDAPLYRALLTRISAPEKDIFHATQVIESWMLGAGLEARQEP